MIPLRIFIGYDSREPLAFLVLCHSILRQASGPVSITPLYQPALRRRRLYMRPRTDLESTEFSLTRFLVPSLCGYGDYAIFMDCDMLCRGDVYELVKIAKADQHRCVWVAKHDYTPKTDTKFLDQVQTPYPRKNWSSVMVFRNKFCDKLTDAYVNGATGLELHQFEWAGHDRNIGDLPLEWNWLVGEYAPNPDAKLLHYTLGGPWFREYQHCDHADLWFEEMDLAIPSINLTKEEVG